MDLKDIEALLYENYQKYKAQGYDVNAIFDQFIDNINKQETTNLDQTVSYTTFNNYDKITYLLATLGVKSDDYLSFIKTIVCTSWCTASFFYKLDLDCFKSI